VNRILVSLAGLVMLGIFAWLLISPLLYPRIHVARLPFVEIDLHAAPRIAFTREDTLELTPIGEVGMKTEEGKFPRELENLQNSASLKSLGTRLQAFVEERWGKELLILSVTALGVSDGGEAYLLCSDFDPTKAETGRFSLKALLAEVKACPADLKLVILDAGRLPRDVRLGMAVNEFPRLLEKELLEGEPDPNLWVMTANSALERSHIAPQYRQSVFGYYVAQGLIGWADLNGDQEVTLEEFSSFVAGNVKKFVNTETNSNESQTPYLMWGGAGQVTDLPANKRFDALKAGNRRQVIVPVSRLAMDAQKKAAEEAEAADLKALEEKQKGVAPKAARRGPVRRSPLAYGGITGFGGPGMMAMLGPLAQAEKTEAKAEDTKSEKAEPAEKKAETKEPAKGDEKAEPKTTKKTEPEKGDGKEEPEEKAEPEKKTPAKAPAKSDKPEPAPLPGVAGLRAALNKSWALRDEYLARKERDGWSPVDYAPHLWREFEDLILGYEHLARSGKGLEDNVAENVTAEIEEGYRRLDDLLHDRKPAAGTQEADKISISQRLAQARPKFIEGVDEPRSFAMAERIGWRPGDPRPRDIQQLAADFDFNLARDSRLVTEASDKFFKFVRGPAAREPNLVEIRLATQLGARQSEIDWKLIKKCLETRRLGERVAAQARPFGVSAGVGENWCPTWIKEHVARGDQLSVSAERTLLTSRPNRFPQAESDLDEARREYDTAWRDIEKVREAIQVKDDVIFRLPYYIRWHCAAGLVTGDAKRLGANTPQASDIKRLFPQLQLLIKMQTDPASISMTQLESETAELARRRDVVEQGLRADIDNLLKQPHLDGHIWRCQTLLSTPLLSAKVRQQILAAMETAPPKSDRLHPVTIDLPSGADPRQATLADWQQIYLQAELELATVRLSEFYSTGSKLPLADEFKALYEANQAFTKDPTSPELIDSLWVAYRKYGASLRDYYANLPGRLKALQRQDDEANNRISQEADVRLARQALLVKLDHQLRFVDFRDTPAAQGLDPAESLRRVNLYELFLFNEGRFKAGRNGAEEAERNYLATSEKAYRSQAHSIVETTPIDSTGPTTQIVFEGENAMKIVGETSQLYEVTIRAEGEPRTNAWVVLQYDPDKLEVRSAADQFCFHRHQLDGEPEVARPTPTFVLRNRVSERLKLQVRAKVPSDTPSPLVVRVKADGAYFTHRIEVTLPIPEAVELVVRGTPGTWTQDKKELILHPFPNNPSDYRFDLRNHTTRPRTVKVELMALAANADGKGFATLPFDSDGFLIPGMPEPKVLAMAPKMVLPEDGSPIPIMFPDPPEAKDAPKPDPAAPVVETRPSVASGMVLVITDEANKQRIIKRIELQPQRPSRYIKPKVSYNLNEGRIEIALEPKDDKLRLPPGGSKVVWDTTGQIPDGANVGVEGNIMGPDFGAQLYAEIGPDDDRIVTVNLTVDGCPRAFIYRVRLNERIDDFKLEEDLQQIRIVSPKRELPDNRYPAFKSPVDSIPVEFQVDVPVNAFRSSDDVIEVGIDKDIDREFRRDKPLRFYTDRQVEVLFDKAQSGGRLKLFTKVGDFKVNLATAGLSNLEVGILGRSFIGGKEKWSDEFAEEMHVILDGTKPVIDKVTLALPRVFLGKPVALVVQASDMHSGVDFIELAFDPERLRKFGKAPPIVVRRDPAEPTGSRWKAELPTDGLKAQAYNILIRATDYVGNVSEYKEVPVVLQNEKPDGPAGPVKNENNIVGTVVFGDEKLGDVKMTLVNPAGQPIATTKTDAKGNFTFKDVPAGPYGVRAEGIVKNRIRNVVLPATVVPQPGPETKMRIPLE